MPHLRPPLSHPHPLVQVPAASGGCFIARPSGVLIIFLSHALLGVSLIEKRYILFDVCGDRVAITVDEIDKGLEVWYGLLTEG